MPPEVITTISQLRDRVAGARLGRRLTRPEPSRGVGFIPTMGALHAGHERLMDLARRECDVVIVSIFVNPLQFDRPDDLDRYPRTLDADVALCSASGVDIVFAPSVAEMYPSSPVCVVDVGRVAEHLCGRFRPGHFRGVATVVLKLFEVTQPDRAYFGEKDAQQLAVVRHLASDFNVPVEIVGVPTVREPDGLALSSRNAYLSRDERARAPTLHRVLTECAARISAGEAIPAVMAHGRQALAETGFAADYLEARHAETLLPIPSPADGPIRLLVAAKLGKTRLIDNIGV